MAHFTYAGNANVEQLCQGDILRVTDDLSKVFTECHPYFGHKEYQYFIVLTQTCELIARSGKRKAKYITIAAVRSISDFMKKIMDGKYTPFGDLQLLDANHLTNLKQLLGRLLNNEEPEYFYMADEPSQGFSEPMVAFLKVSIALKADLHYQTCLNAKVLELTDTFKAKLGWLVGQMYSKVGTPDWTTSEKEDEYKQRIEEMVNNSFIVGKKQQLNELVKAIEQGHIDPNDIDDVKRAIDKIEIETYCDKMFKAFNDICRSHAQLFASRDAQDEFYRTLISSSKIQSYIKPD